MARLFLFLLLFISSVAQSQMHLDSLYADKSQLLFNQKTILVNSVSKSDLIKKLKDWGWLNYSKFEDVLVYETENQLTLNYVSKDFQERKKDESYQYNWKIKTVIQVEDGKVIIQQFDDGKDVSTSEVTNTNKELHLTDFFQSNSIAIELYENGLNMFKTSLNNTINSIENSLNNSMSSNQASSDVIDSGLRLKDNSVLYPEKILFKTNSDLYFEIGDDKYYKLPLTFVVGNVDCQKLNSSKFSNYLLKFVKQSQTGITLSILGTTGSVLLPFVVKNVAVLVIPPVISLTGFIVWASSYSHLKKYGIIESAIEYK
jgi:hypothetical protein